RHSPAARFPGRPSVPQELPLRPMIPRESSRARSKPAAAGKTPSALAKEVEKLRAEIDRHSHLYYVEQRPEVSDAEFDQLWARLAESEPAHPEVVTPGSPTQRVGVEPQAKFETIDHVAP